MRHIDLEKETAIVFASVIILVVSHAAFAAKPSKPLRSAYFPVGAICSDGSNRAILFFSQRPTVEIVVGDGVRGTSPQSTDKSQCQAFGPTWKAYSGNILIEAAEIISSDDDIIDTPGSDVYGIIESYYLNHPEYPRDEDFWYRIEPNPIEVTVGTVRYPFAVAGRTVSAEELLLLGELTEDTHRSLLQKESAIRHYDQMKFMVERSKTDALMKETVEDLVKKGLLPTPDIVNHPKPRLTEHEEVLGRVLSERRFGAWAYRARGFLGDQQKASPLVKQLNQKGDHRDIISALRMTLADEGKHVEEAALFHSEVAFMKEALDEFWVAINAETDELSAIALAEAQESALPSDQKVLAKEPLITYDDSWQFGWFAVDKDFGVFGWKYRTWQCKIRALRHERFVRVSGLMNDPHLDEVGAAATNCLGQASVMAVAAALITGGSAAWPAFVAVFGECMGDKAVSLSLEDSSHWTDWQNCT